MREFFWGSLEKGVVLYFVTDSIFVCIMKEFFRVNGHKIPSQVLFLSILVFALFAIALLIEWRRVNIEVLVHMCLLALVSVFIATLIMLLQEVLEFNRAKKMLSEPVFEKLPALGFSKAYSNPDSTWFISQPILQAVIDGFPATLEVEKGIPRLAIEFCKDDITDEQRNRLKELIGYDIMENDWLGMTMVYKPKLRKALLPHDINRQLLAYINFLKVENIKPWPEEWY